MRFFRSPFLLLFPFPFAIALSAAPAVKPDTAATAAIVRTLPISAHAYAGSSVNVTANSHSSLFTDSRTQFAAFYDADGFLILAKRALGSDTWETRRTAYRGDVADAPAFISLSVDGAGYLHVVWDQHGSPLHYARSTAPGSLELGSPGPMTGLHEDRVTCPQFFRLPAGDLLFLSRNGTADNGSLVLARYATATGKWSVVQPNLVAIERGGDGRTADWAMTVDRGGTLHLAWLWRDSPGASSHQGLAYARSINGGATWTGSDGTVLTPPLTAVTAELAQTISPGNEPPLPPVIAADSGGRPFICGCWSSGEGARPQFQIAFYDGKAWQSFAGPRSTPSVRIEDADTDVAHRSARASVSPAVLLVDSAIRLIFRDDAHGGRAVVATHDLRPNGEWSERALTKDSVGHWEPSIDPVAWDRFQQAHLLVENVASTDVNDRSASHATRDASAALTSLIWAPASERMRASAPVEKFPIAKPDDRPLDAAAIYAIAQRAADWQWAHFPAPNQRHPRGWEVAPFYLGVLALDHIAPDRRNRERMLRQAEAIGWQPHTRLYHADDECVIQAYYELYQRDRDPRMIAASKKRFDEILAHPPTARFDWGTGNFLDRWSWCDSLFMAPVAWLQTWQATGDPRYLEFMNREWWITTARLYRPEAGFYFRDESYLDLREANGQTIHWSRGNGWVFAGLARVLDLFPKNHPDYPRYVALYRQMAAAVLAAQQPDGLWRVGLLDPAAHPVRETSGSAFYTFGLAWGVNRGLLDRAALAPRIRRAWNALTSCITADGKLEHVQPIGAAPEGFDPHHTDAFAVGAFLLAASEVFSETGSGNMSDRVENREEAARLASLMLPDPIWVERGQDGVRRDLSL